MKTTNKYPVYEKDQVLSAQNLNDTTQYLEHQDLLTRRLLIGTGIACGLELNLTEEELKISAGNGVTSMGYLIDFCGDKSYTQVRDYTLPANPKYLPFHDKKNKPFKLWELCEEKEELGENLTAFKKLGANFFRDKVVVLFLEIEHVDLKNCIEGDCDDKGSELVFTVRPLLVLLKDLMLYFSKDDDTLEDLNSAILAKYAIKKIVCPRFDVLAQRLTNHNQIAEVFSDNISTVVPRIDIALTFIETLYEDKLEATKILTQRWAQVKKVIEAAKKDPETVQLAYDYVCDLSAAINEFSKEASEWMVECCPDIDLFPQHLALGELANLGQDVPKLFRNYFVHAPTSPAAHQKLGAVKFYLDRVLGILTEYRFFEEKEIKIIPSVYGKEPLSEKAIPFYLQPNEKSNWNWLRQWNFKKNNFGGWKYNNYYYNNPEAVLDLDIEEYSFFRIDGHVGKNYQDALREVQSKINSYRVPIKVMALSTGGVPVDANPIPESRFQDLEALFDAAKTELFCGLEAPLCAVASINPAANTNRAVDVKAAAPNFSFSDILGSQFTATVNAASATYTHYTPQARMFTYKQVIIQHVKGQFLSQKCDVREGSFGRAYLDLVKNEPFKSSRILELYQNYIGLGTPTSGKIILFLLITIDEIEELVGLIKPATLSNFKFDELKAFILGFRNFLDQFIDLLDKYIAASDGEIPYYLDGLSDKLKSLKAICTLKKIVGILNEHRLRTLEILEEWRFENFTQKHPGIDHKSGTTKGGTLLLVYHSTEKTEQYKPFTLDKLNLKLPAMNLMATVYASKKEGGENTRTAAMKMAEAYEIGTAKKTLAEEAHAFAESRGLKINPEILNRFGDMFISGIDRKDEVVATDGMVLFDFFLPYVCCGEGGTQINLPEPKVLIALEDRQFCKNDENSYEFTLSPAGGQVTGPGVEESEEGYSFSPSAEDVPLGKVSFTYVAQGRTATFAVNVEEAPEADFEYSTDGGSVGTYVSFENKSKNAKNYVWEFGDKKGNTSTEENPTHLYDFDEEEVTVKLTASNEICGGDTKEVTIRLFEKEYEMFLTKHNTFCENDKSEAEVIIGIKNRGEELPLTGTVKGPGVTMPSDKGKRATFNPSAAGKGKHTLQYIIDGKVVAEVEVTVVASFNATFTAKTLRSEFGVEIQISDIKPADAFVYNWYFNPLKPTEVSTVKNDSKDFTFFLEAAVVSDLPTFEIRGEIFKAPCQDTHRLTVSNPFFNQINSGDNTVKPKFGVGTVGVNHGDVVAKLSTINSSTNMATLGTASKSVGDAVVAMNTINASLSKASTRTKVLNGSSNTLISKVYKEALDGLNAKFPTRVTVSNKNKTKLVASAYLQTYMSMVNVIFAQSKDLSKRSTLYKTYSDASAGVVRALKLGVPAALKKEVKELNNLAANETSKPNASGIAAANKAVFK